MILTKLLLLILPIFVCAQDDGFLTKFYSRKEGISNIKDLKTKWADIQNKLTNLSSKEVGRIISSIMDHNGNNDSIPHISPRCSRDLMATLMALKKMERWAFEMIDAAGKIPSGILKGRSTNLGDYDECLSIEVKDRFLGKYCYVEILPPNPKVYPFYFSNRSRIEAKQFIDLNSLAGSMIKSYGPHSYYFNLGTALCLPSTCTEEDIENISNKILKTLQSDISVKIHACQTKEDGFKMSNLVIICMVIVSTASGLCLVGTILDSYMEKLEKHGKIQNVLKDVLLCFSMRRNWIKLMNTDATEQMGVFRGMKVMSMLWVILNHTYLFIVPPTYDSMLYAKNLRSSLLFQVVINGYYSVEVFFFMSAVLLVYTRMKSNVKNMGLFHYVFYRAWRLLPPSLFITAVAILLGYAGPAPFWNETYGYLYKRCKNYWWHNLIFINNYTERSKRCIPWTWYLAAEMHLYLLSFPVIVTIKKNPIRGAIAIAVLAVIGIAALVINQIVYNLPPTVVASAIWTPEDALYYLHRLYYPSHVHIATYAVGLATGFLIYCKPNIRIPKLANICGYILSIGLGLTLVYGVQTWNYDESEPPSMVVSVLYACASKIIYSSCLAFVTISCATGNSSIVNSLLSWKVFAPLSRVSFMVYLVHPLIQFLYTGRLRNYIDIHYRSMVYLYLGYVLASVLVAFVFSLIFEAPFIALEKIIFKGPPPKVESVMTQPASDDKQNNWNKVQNKSDDLNGELKDIVSK